MTFLQFLIKKFCFCNFLRGGVWLFAENIEFLTIMIRETQVYTSLITFASVEVNNFEKKIIKNCEIISRHKLSQIF